MNLGAEIAPELRLRLALKDRKDIGSKNISEEKRVSFMSNLSFIWIRSFFNRAPTFCLLYSVYLWSSRTIPGASQVALVVKNLPANAVDLRDSGLSSIPGSGRSSGGAGHRNPLQYSYLENFMNRGAWQAIVHGVAKSQTQMKWLSTHTGLNEI